MSGHISLASNPSDETHRVEFSVMAGSAEIQFVGREVVRSAEIASKLIDEARRLERKYSLFLPESVTTQINAAAGGTAVIIDQETNALLDVAERAFELSSGLFDITSGALRGLWTSTRKTKPTEAEIAATLKLVGWRKVERSQTTVRLPRTGMRLDFGGIVKEYAVDRLTVLAQEHGVGGALVNLAGDVRCYGSEWRIGIRDPFHRDRVHSTLNVNNGAVATSGDYERSIMIEEVAYSHLVNPRTGWPIRSFASVSVCATTCSLAGLLSTTAMLLGPEGGMNLLNQCGFAHLAIEQPCTS